MALSEAIHKPVLTVSTVGTSVLDACTRLAPELKNIRAQDCLPDDPRIAEIEECAAAAREFLDAGSPELLRQKSAEIAGLLAYHERFGVGLRPQDQHILIVTDTCAGQHAAQIVAEGIRTVLKCPTVMDKSFDGLAARNAREFDRAMAEFVIWCSETIGLPSGDAHSYQGQQHHVVFNVTGGFKAVQGYLTVLGMAYADHVAYVFERSTEVLVIPRMPLPTSSSEMLREHAVTLARLSHGFLPYAEIDGVPEMLLEEYEDDAFTLGAWGRLAWEQGRKDVLGERLLEWPGISYAPAVRDAFERQKDKNLRTKLQDTLAEISIVLEHDGGPSALRGRGSLDYDKLGHVRLDEYPDVYHFRVDYQYRVVCAWDEGQLHLIDFLSHGEFDRRYN